MRTRQLLDELLRERSGLDSGSLPGIGRLSDELLVAAVKRFRRMGRRQRSAHDDAAWVLDRDELLRRFTALPAETFPHTSRYAAEVTAGEGHHPFDFTLTLMTDGLAHR
jgi:hypothetical protein